LVNPCNARFYLFYALFPHCLPPSPDGRDGRNPDVGTDVVTDSLENGIGHHVDADEEAED